MPPTSPGSEENTPVNDPKDEEEFLLEDDSQEDPSASSESQEPQYIQIRADQLSNEIARLEAENEEFARIFNSKAGDRAARKYRSQIQERDNQIEELRKQLRSQEIRSMDPEEIEEKFADDPDFAKEYAELVHYKPQPPQQDDNAQIARALGDLFDYARSKGMTEEEIQQFHTKTANGQYDRGNEDTHWSEPFQRLQVDITNYLLSKNGASSSKSKVNSELGKGSGPDLTPSNRKKGSAAAEVPKTAAAFKALPVAKQMEILDDPEGYAAVQKLANIR